MALYGQPSTKIIEGPKRNTCKSYEAVYIEKGDRSCTDLLMTVKQEVQKKFLGGDVGERRMTNRGDLLLTMGNRCVGADRIA